MLSDHPIAKLGTSCLAVRLAMNPEMNKGNGQHYIRFNFFKAIYLKMTHTKQILTIHINYKKQIPLEINKKN